MYEIYLYEKAAKYHQDFQQKAKLDDQAIQALYHWLIAEINAAIYHHGRNK